MDFELIRAHRKHPIIIYGGCVFWYQKSCREHLRWKCRWSWKDKVCRCPCVLKTNCDLNRLKIIAVDHNHTHPEDHSAIASLKQQIVADEQVASQRIHSSITYSDVRKKLPTNKNGKRIRDTVKENYIDKKKSIHYIEDQHINNNNIRDGDFQNNNLKQVINRNNNGKDNHVDYNSNKSNTSVNNITKDDEELKKMLDPVTGLQVLKNHVIRHICNQIIHLSDLGESKNDLAVFIKRENEWKMKFDRKFQTLKALKESILRSQNQKSIPRTHRRDVRSQVDILNKDENVTLNGLETNNQFETVVKTVKPGTNDKITTPGTDIKIPLQPKSNFNFQVVQLENTSKIHQQHIKLNLNSRKTDISYIELEVLAKAQHKTPNDIAQSESGFNRVHKIPVDKTRIGKANSLKSNTVKLGVGIKRPHYELNFSPIQSEVSDEIIHPQNTYTKGTEHKADFNSRLSKMYTKNPQLKTVDFTLSDVKTPLTETQPEKFIEKILYKNSNGLEIFQLKTVDEKIQHKTSKLQSNIKITPSKSNIRTSKNGRSTKVKQHEAGYKKTHSKSTTKITDSIPLKNNNSFISVLTNLKSNILEIDLTESDDETSDILEKNINQYESSIEKKQTETAVNVTKSKVVHSNKSYMPIFTDLNQNSISSTLTISKLNKPFIPNDTNSRNNVIKTKSTKDNCNKLFKKIDQIEESTFPELNDKRPNQNKNASNHLSSTLEKHKFKSYNSFDQIRHPLQTLADVAYQNKEDLIDPVVKLTPVPAGIPIFSQKGSMSFDDENLFDERPIVEVKFDVSSDQKNKIFPTGVVVKWDFNSKTQIKNIKSYELYSTIDLSPSKPTWSKISEFKPLPLPMSCTLKLAQFRKNTYFFIIRAKYLDGKFGSFSIPLSTPSLSESVQQHL